MTLALARRHLPAPTAHAQTGCSPSWTIFSTTSSTFNQMTEAMSQRSTFELPVDLRLSIQKLYIERIHAAFPDATIEEMAKAMTESRDEIDVEYDQCQACVDLEPEDHRYFRRELNWAEWCEYIFTGIPITFWSLKDRQDFGTDILEKCGHCLCDSNDNSGCEHCCDEDEA